MTIHAHTKMGSIAEIPWPPLFIEIAMCG